MRALEKSGVIACLLQKKEAPRERRGASFERGNKALQVCIDTLSIHGMNASQRRKHLANSQVHDHVHRRGHPSDFINSGAFSYLLICRDVPTAPPSATFSLRLAPNCEV